MGLNEVFKKVSAINEVTELASHQVELALMDDINKIKQTIVSEWKSHVSKRDAWGAESSKILQSIGQHESKGIQLKKEVDIIDKKLLDLSSQLTKLRNQAQSLGLELPREINLLDGIAVNAWGNKLVDTREIVDEFKNKLK